METGFLVITLGSFQRRTLCVD